VNEQDWYTAEYTVVYTVSCVLDCVLNEHILSLLYRSEDRGNWPASASFSDSARESAAKSVGTRDTTSSSYDQ
jgi:hypothetical protein